jgi:hypothetical protein
MTIENERTHVETQSTARSGWDGVDTPAALLGMFTAFGVLAFLGALFGAGAASIPYQLNAFDLEGNVVELAIGGVLIAAAAVFVSFLAGGWATGRMAGVDGGINGLASALWALLLVAIFAALGAFAGAEYNAFQRVGLPDWFSQLRGDDVTALGIGGAVLGIAAMFGGAYLGGRMADRQVRRVVTRRDEVGAVARRVP